MKKIILVDGNNLLFRSYYATAYQGTIMRNSKGFPTNALYGFINMMNKIIKEENPSYIMVAFDKGKTFRHDKYDSYKAGRAAVPDELKMQFPKAKEVLDAMGIKHFEIDQYEADDIIGTLSRMVEEDDDFISTIVSSDKDLLQLISDQVVVKLLKQQDSIMMTKEEFQKVYQVDPIKMIDLKALMGDSSDNIPGVKGIGEKTAISLLAKYGSLDSLYEHIDEVSPKTREKLMQDRDNAYMSYDIATIYREVPLPFSLEDCKYLGINSEKFLNELEELEFKSLIRKYNIDSLSVSSQEKEKESIEIKDMSEFHPNGSYSFYLETKGAVYSKSEILGISIYDGKYGYFISKEDIPQYSNLFQDDFEKYTYDIKKSLIVLHPYSYSFSHVTFDTMIALYLLDYTVKDDISYVAKSFDFEIPFYEDFFGTEKRPKEFSSDELKALCVQKAKFIYDTHDSILNRIYDTSEKELFEDIEMPLAFVLADMEIEGISVSRSYLEEMKEELSLSMKKLEEEIYHEASHEFNILSPSQLSKVLFEELEIPYPKKVSKDKYSTSKDILDKISFIHPIVPKILEYRTLSKLYANYAVGLIDEIREDGKIHTIFTQTLTRTGRLSSIEPNLQNIPARDDYARLIRKAFVPEKGYVLLSSDYSQVELRIFASMSHTEQLMEAFRRGEDIHARTASLIFHVPLDEVTKDMRRTAKAVNFGILYGISSFGLSEDLGISMREAKKFIDDYLETFSGIRDYMDEEKKIAYEKGYVTTLMNRKRVIEELNSSNYMVRSSGERMALNTPIQGTAADILKKAMVDIYKAFDEKKLKSKMILQVHDELVFHVPLEELEEVTVLVRDLMENAFPLDVPLKVDIHYGNDWYEAK